MTDDTLTDVLRHALFDPAVRKQRVVHYIVGYTVNADDLRRAIAARAGDGSVTAAQVDAAIRSAGGQRVRASPLQALRAALGRPRPVLVLRRRLLTTGPSPQDESAGGVAQRWYHSGGSSSSDSY